MRAVAVKTAVRNAVDELMESHTPELVRTALRFLPKIIELVKKGREHRLEKLLEEAHDEVDRLAEAIKGGG